MPVGTSVSWVGLDRYGIWTPQFKSTCWTHNWAGGCTSWCPPAEADCSVPLLGLSRSTWIGQSLWTGLKHGELGGSRKPCTSGTNQGGGSDRPRVPTTTQAAIDCKYSISNRPRLAAWQGKAIIHTLHYCNRLCNLTNSIINRALRARTQGVYCLQHWHCTLLQEHVGPIKWRHFEPSIFGSWIDRRSKCPAAESSVCLPTYLK